MADTLLAGPSPSNPLNKGQGSSFRLPKRQLQAFTVGRRRTGQAAMAALGTATLALTTLLSCAAPAPAAPSAAKPAPAAATEQSPVARPPERLRVVYLTTGKTWSQVPLIIAEEKGFFAAENLEVEINFGGQSSTVCQSLASRSVDMGNCSINDLIQAVEI